MPLSPPFPLTLCMIVKDEAQTLARCLDSARPWVSAAIVVDTGSTDATVAIAEAHGARVLHTPWTDDFAAARNVSLDAAATRWALVLDADETLVVTDADALARALAHPTAAGYYVSVVNVADDGSETTGPVLRLLDLSVPGMRYRGRLHEQLAAVADGQASSAPLTAVHIRHTGYGERVMRERAKLARNARLAQTQAEESPEDPFSWYALGLSYAPGDAAHRLPPFEKALALLQGSGVREAWVEGLHLSTLNELALTHDPRACAAADAALVRFPDAPDAWFQRAELKRAAGDHRGAIADLRTVLTLPAAPLRLRFRDDAGRTRAATHLLVDSLRTLGLAGPDLALLEEAHALAPADAATHLALGFAYLQAGRAKDAVPLLAAAGPALYGRALLEAGRPADAAPHLTAAGDTYAFLAGLAQLASGQPVAAAVAWKRLLKTGTPAQQDAAAAMIQLATGTPALKQKGPFAPDTVDLIAEALVPLLEAQAFDPIETIIERASRLPPRQWHPLRARMGAVLARTGFTDLGADLLMRAFHDRPRDPDVLYWLGHCALSRSGPADAVPLWEAALAARPDHPLAATALALVGRGASMGE